jgi:pimeloyl-ACP methyl ester carboxylesterase
MAKALINGINMHYQVRGEGPDVILIHGITSCLAQWYLDISPALSQQYRVTVYDLRGHGLTELTSGGYDSRSMALDLDALMNHIGIERACLVGHSFGGAIALHQALLSPDRVSGAVLLDTGLACLRYLRVIEEWSGWKMHGDDLARFGITLGAFLEIDRQQDVTEVIRRSLSVPIQTGFRKGQNGLTPRLKKLLDETKMGSEFREIAGLTEEKLAKLQCPVLAIYGGRSPYAKMAEHLGTLLRNCRYELLHEAGHFYAIEEPGMVLERLTAFLQNPVGYVTRPSPAACE